MALREDLKAAQLELEVANERVAKLEAENRKLRAQLKDQESE